MTPEILSLEEFLSRTGTPVLDVRSPGEFETGHIHGALSFPLFSDSERAEVGTIYKQKGPAPAMKRGLDIVGPKMSSFLDRAEGLDSTDLRLYCWRGGKRSESMAWLLGQAGFRPYVLEGGYKTYRRALVALFNEKWQLRVISGYTGSRKTDFLKMLSSRGEQVADLEGIANHQGSSFGNRKSAGQPSSEHFQNLVFEAFRKFDRNRPVWIEDESMRIGQVSLPESLYLLKNDSPHYVIEIDKNERVNFLVQDYGDLSAEQLSSATLSIERKLGKNNASEALQHIAGGRLDKAAEIILVYYDTRYKRSLEKKSDRIFARYKIKMNELERLADELAGT